MSLLLLFVGGGGSTTSVALTGQVITPSCGIFTPGFSFALSGQSLTLSKGAFTNVGVVIALTAQQTLIVSQGSLILQSDSTVAISGLSFSISLGSLAIPDRVWTSASGSAIVWTPATD